MDAKIIPSDSDVRIAGKIIYAALVHRIYSPLEIFTIRLP